MMKRLLPALVALTVSALPVAAQDDAQPQDGDEVGWYVVQPGDTLERITQKHLGDPELWRENWRLNPDVADPHALRPGQRIRVILSHKVPTAEIVGLARRVEEKPFPGPWTRAEMGSRLRARDGVRTYESSSAELGFEDGSSMVVTEQSVVFLRTVGSRLEGTPRQSLEIVEGQADVTAAVGAAEGAAGDIEVIVGGAHARSRPGTDAAGQTRTRRTGDGGAQVMVYAGIGEVQAGGGSVSVEPGMGTAVPVGGRPLPPEKLLPAPRLVEPAAGAGLSYANPTFRWDPVAKAESYVLEICRDRSCGTLVARIGSRRREEWSADGLPLGQLYWRVTAVSASGLDGFPSEPAPLTIRSLWRRQK